MPEISVIMSTYNENKKYLTLAIESILEQDLQDFEFIIILDNPSNKEIKNIVRQYALNDLKIKIIENKKNLGLVNSINKGIKVATGEYIARMDADDISFPYRLKEQLAYIKSKKLDMVCALKFDIDENDNIIGKKYLPELGPSDIRNLLPYNPFITHPSILIKTNVIKSVGGYRNIECSEDYDLWLRLLLCNFKLGLMDTYLLKYRIRYDGISKSNICRQVLTTEFLQDSYKNGRLNGDISKDLDLFLEINGYYKNRELIDTKYHQYVYSINLLKKKKIIKGFLYLLKSLFGSKVCRKLFCTTIIFKCKFRKLKSC